MKRKIIISIMILLALSISFVPGIFAQGKVAVVANSVDIEMNPSLLTLLRENGFVVDYFGAKDKGYTEYDYIIILGGPDSKEHTGELSKKILNDSDQNILRSRRYRLMSEASEFFKPRQKIFIIAGSDRDFTKAAVDQYIPQIIAKINEKPSEATLSRNLTAKDLKQLIDSKEDIFLIDVRTQAEFDKGSIAGAINIPYDRLRFRLNDIPKDKKVVLFCDTGVRAVNGAMYLNQNNFDNIYILRENYIAYKMLQ